MHGWQRLRRQGLVFPQPLARETPVASSSQKAGSAVVAGLAACSVMSAKADNKAID